MKYSARLIVFSVIFFTLTLCGNFAFPYTAPDPAKTFYADANGDQQLQLDDLPMHKSQVYLGTPAYNTPQLNNVDDRWNTCDVTGDFRCQLDDMTPLKAAVYLTALAKNWDSWTIVDVSFPTTANVGEAKAFRISPRAVSGGVSNARPGINVKLTVAPNSPVQNVILGGRTCPVVDPKCAVSVGITQWQISTVSAPTETGAYGFSFTANASGNLILVAEFTAQPTMKIAATSVRFTATIVPSLTIDINCPASSVEELSPMSCVVTASGGTPQVDSLNDTCGGTINGSGPWTYDFVPTESQGPGSCVVAAKNGSITDSQTIVVGEVNEDPYWNISPSSIQIYINEVYDDNNGYALDDDLPNSGAGAPGFVTCSVTNNTCAFPVQADGAGYGEANCHIWFTAPPGPETCTVDVVASDAWIDAGSVSEQRAIIIMPPFVSIDCSNPGPNPVNENFSMQCGITAGGGTPLIEAGFDTCGGTINGTGPWTYDFTPDELEGPGSCYAAVESSAGPAYQDSEIITINEVNQNPYWTTQPSNLEVPVFGGYSGINGEAADNDLPNAALGDPGLLQCAGANNTCSFPITVTGNGAGSEQCNISFTNAMSVETCTVDIVVSDGWTPAGSVTKTITIDVVVPSISIDCSNPGPNPINELVSMQCLITTKGGTPFVDAFSDTCGGTISGTKPYYYNYSPTEADGPKVCNAAVEHIAGPMYQDADSISVNEVNQNPYWDIPPSSISMYINETYNDYNGYALDDDLPTGGPGAPGYVTCSAMNSTCGFAVSVSGASYGEANCNISFTAPPAPETCTVDIVASDAWTPAGSVSQQITIKIMPPFVSIDCSNPGPNPLNENEPLKCAILAGGGAPETDWGNDTCGGFINAGYYQYMPMEMSGPGVCVAAVQNNPYTTYKDQETVTINEVNMTPVWYPEPSDVTITINQPYNKLNGAAFDMDFPWANPTDPGYVTCSKTATTCSFPVAVSGSGANYVNCSMSFTAPSGTESCTVTIQVSDGYSAIISKTINVSIVDAIFVDSRATGAGNGYTWQDAYTNVQDAANAATPGVKIWVAQGTYKRPVMGVGPVLTMQPNNMIYGGFVGNELTFSERPDPPLPTILDGETFSKHVVIAASNALLDGVDITGGNANSVGSPDDLGGGILAMSTSNLTIRNCNLKNNYGEYGGGIYMQFTSATISNCTFSNNNANYAGGLYINLSSALTLTNCVFYGNDAALWGGAIINVSDEMPVITRFITNCTFTGNHATVNGGAIVNGINASLTINNSIFWGDRASSSGNEIYNSAGATTTVTYSDVEGGYTGTGNINSYPRFFGYPNLRLIDYTSPCVDSGTALGAPIDDHDGNLRPSGSGVDMGAYEVQWTTCDWFVDIDATGLETGDNWADAFTVVQDAVDAALAGETVCVAKGVYLSDGYSSDIPVIDLKSGVDVYGGFSGFEDFLFQRLYPELNPTILDGDGFLNHIVTASGVSDVALDGFSLYDGGYYYYEFYPYDTGAGMYISNSAGVTVSNCKFSESLAQYGAGLASENSETSIENCEFIHNQAKYKGSGIYTNGGSNIISNCLVKDNYEYWDYYDQNSILMGAGMHIGGSDTITNCILIGNTADQGAGIYIDNASPSITNCTFNKNFAGVFGGGIVVNRSRPIIKNTILWGDYAPSGPEMILKTNGGINSFAQISYSDAQGGQAAIPVDAGSTLNWGSGMMNSNPQYAEYPDAHLAGGSPCINTATSSGAPSTDYDGAMRPSGAGYDMGAYEFQGVGANWFVNDDAALGGDGKSWGAAFRMPQQAVDAAGSGDIIFVAEGAYFNVPASTASVLILKPDIKIYGGFVGTETYLHQRGDPSLTPSVIAGEFTSYHVVTGASNVVFDGFGIEDGNANGSGFNTIGGGMFNYAVFNLTVNNCVFITNSAVGGGAIYNGYSLVDITDCLFLSNNSSAGGAIRNSMSVVSINRSKFDYNQSTGAAGAIDSMESTGAITNCTFVGSSGSSSGTLQFSQQSDFTLTNCTFTGNTSANGYGVGRVLGSEVNMANNIFWNNPSLNQLSIGVLQSGGINSTLNISYSDLQKGRDAISVDTGSTLNWGWVMIDTDPKFISGLPPYDLHLHEDSPCVDRVWYEGPDDDLDGNPRPSGNYWDMGAYEYRWPIADWYVNDNATGTQTGRTWADAFLTVAQAINAASGGDVIFVAQGTYSTGTTNSVVVMKDSVDIYGGFNGYWREKNLADRDDRPFYYPTILDGLNTSYHVVQCANNARLDGFIVQNGAADTFPEYDGGGIICLGKSNPVISNCLIRSNYADVYGGGIFSDSSNLEIVNTKLLLNSANAGGGMASLNASITVDNCVYAGNRADIYAGGLLLLNGSTSIDNTSFNNNNTPGAGGGLKLDMGNYYITNCEFFGNVANYGAGLNNDCFNGSTTALITNCAFTQNLAVVRGGALMNENGATTTIRNSVLWKNSAPLNPEIYNLSAPAPTVTYSDVTGGYTGTGNIDADPMFKHVPAFVEMTTGSGTTTTITVADASRYHVEDIIEISGDGASWRVVTAASGTTVTFNQPLPSASTSYMSIENWQVSEDEAQDLSLLIEDSPCVDAGTATMAPVEDKYGNPRPSGTGYDMGVYEFQWPVAEWFVDSSKVDNSGSGKSWAEAKKTIQAAVNLAVDGDDVFVKAGTYTEQVSLNEEVSIFGGFEGDETGLWERGNPALTPTIIDGQNTRSIVSGSGNFRIDGFDIRNGYSGMDGGGMYLLDWNGPIMVSNCAIRSNHSEDYGGGIYNGSGLTVYNCGFYGNSADGQGGAISSFDGIVIINSVFDGNTAAGAGGAVVNVIGGNGFFIENSLFTDNVSGAGGAAIDSWSNTSIFNCTFNGNSSTGEYDQAAVTITFDPNYITNSILWGDTPREIDTSFDIVISYSDVQGGWTGTGNINVNPLFVAGPYGDFYLSQIAAGQPITSPCLNTGSSTAHLLGFDTKTTRTDLVVDTGTVDMGYHYQP